MAKAVTNQQGKAQYSKPKLSVYGEFANLTAAATGSVAEGMAMTAMMRRA